MKILLPEEVLDELLIRIEKRTQKPWISTGLYDLDELTWGLHQGELFVISAKTKHCKTSLACKIAWNAVKEDKSVLFVSLEMTASEIMGRIFCQDQEVNGFQVLRKANMTPEVDQKFLRFRGRIQASKLMIMDTFGFDSETILQLVDQFDPKPDLVVVDHVQRARSIKNQTRYEAISNYVGSLKYISQVHKCAVAACSQLNRSGNDPKWSSDIEETADCLLKCNWPKDNPADMSRYVIEVAYNRFGPCDEIEVNFIPETFEFKNRYGRGK